MISTVSSCVSSNYQEEKSDIIIVISQGSKWHILKASLVVVSHMVMGIKGHCQDKLRKQHTHKMYIAYLENLKTMLKHIYNDTMINYGKERKKKLHVAYQVTSFSFASRCS